jgi:homoserine O-acetyltransferase
MMGGMTALAVLMLHPGIARSHVNISGSAQALPFSIAIRSLQREAIRMTPRWNGGHYDDDAYPESGMRMARKLGVITYRSALEWDGRFGRVRLDSDQTDDDPFGLEFQVESYLEGHARRFVRFFDPTAICT